MQKVRSHHKKILDSRSQTLGTALAVIDKNGRPTGGGCCTWYHESDLLSQVEKRLGNEIPTMEPSNLELPRQISDAMSRGVLFGSSAEFEGRIKSHEAKKALAKAVKNLSDLETRAQRLFFDMARQFGKS